MGSVIIHIVLAIKFVGWVGSTNFQGMTIVLPQLIVVNYHFCHPNSEFSVALLGPTTDPLTWFSDGI